ncbi:MAG TPA: maltose alpha-D-glucosyltransferase [Acidimicrobiales bacterium]|nr:maltose alpha-D-glucosyltransferase [Acidimicrobiales bacterium]
MSEPRPRVLAPRPVSAGSPDWYKDAVIYELHVRAFADSDGDGRGDFRGLTSHLDYLHQLGVTALWLLPFYPSPLRDDGYDIADYTAIHPDYGTLADFRRFVEEAHRRDIRVITELVLNHTSDQHPWFQRARRAPAGSNYRDFYVWSDTPERYEQARIIFQDFEQSNWAWDPVAKAYYWHRFYSHQPDLNYHNPSVRRAMLRTVDFWLRLGVDGLRLDAVPYLYEREGTDCENLPETHEFLRELRRHVDSRFPDRMLLAEANQWPEDASAYFGKGDECHMAFHFPLMPRLFMALRMEDRFPIIDILQQTPEIPESCQWALFLRNHDELTLEMVTDEERDYMYRSYARDPVMRVNLGIRRRLAPLLQYHRQKIELMHGLLMSMPGTPVLYYGDEIGMGDNVYLGDRNSVRTPMQWNADRNAGFSAANPQRLFLPVNIDPQCHYETVNVAAQLDNPDSLLRWIRRLVALRKRHPVFGRGRMDFVASDNPRVLAFVRHDDEERVLVVANLSRFAAYVELDLSAYRGAVPRELFGQSDFPMIGELPYLVTLAPHTFYWLSLGGPLSEAQTATISLPSLTVGSPWWRVLEPDGLRRLEAILPAVLRTRRWFAGKGRRIQSATVAARLSLPLEDPEVERAELVVVAVEYLDGESDRYFMPIVHLTGERASDLAQDHPEGVLAMTGNRRGEPGLLADAHFVPAFGRALVELVAARRRRGPEAGYRLLGIPVGTAAAALASVATGPHAPARVSAAEQSNTSIVVGEPDGTRAIVKTLRRLESGPHPEIELGRLLTATGSNAARLLGSIELVPERGPATALAVVHELVPNESDAWTYALRSAGTFLEQHVEEAGGSQLPLLPPRPGGFGADLAADEVPEEVETQMSEMLGSAELLGRRTAELHVALSSPAGGSSFRPEPVTPMTQRSTYQSMRSAARRTLSLVRQRMAGMGGRDRQLAEELISNEDRLLAAFQEVLGIRSGCRIRVHGDLHLGQVLFTGRDFVFVDFEGEPERSFAERRLKRSPMRDVAGMLRSYQYAGQSAVDDLVARGVIDSGEPEAVEAYERAANRWSHWASVAFWQGYLPLAGQAGLLAEEGDLAVDLRAHLIEKALYELRYELGNRPEWVHLPLLGLRTLLELEPAERP